MNIKRSGFHPAAQIDSWYNARRRHSAIGYISPLQYEHHLARQADQTALQAA